MESDQFVNSGLPNCDKNKRVNYSNGDSYLTYKAVNKSCNQQSKNFDSDFDDDLIELCIEVEKANNLEPNCEETLIKNCESFEKTVKVQQGRAIQQKTNAIFNNPQKTQYVNLPSISRDGKAEEHAEDATDVNMEECTVHHTTTKQHKYYNYNNNNSSIIPKVSNKTGETAFKNPIYTYNIASVMRLKDFFVSSKNNLNYPLVNSSFIKLPLDIANKKAVINVKNTDFQCLKWALLSALYPAASCVDRVAKYIKHENKLNFSGITFPAKITDIPKVEQLNNISINVYGLEYNTERNRHIVIGPLHFTKSYKPTHVNLLYISKGSYGHYCYIKNLSRLVSKQVTRRNNAIFICDECLVYFNTNEALILHKLFNDCVHFDLSCPIYKALQDILKSGHRGKMWLSNL